jgi:hypothetical protein
MELRVKFLKNSKPASLSKAIALSLPVLFFLMAATVPQCPLTTTTYKAPTGTVSSTLYTTMHLTGGGVVTLSPVVGPSCYYGMTCHFPAGYVGTYMSYVLPDGSNANLTNFNGVFAPLSGGYYEISGQASGIDSEGRSVTVDNVQADMHISCRSGRGGGCSKVYSGGTFTLTIGLKAPPTPTATAKPTPSPTPTSIPDS